jgi:hypothetical protein
MPIEIPELGDTRHAMWLALIGLARQPFAWTLIGAHMVALHAWEAGLQAQPSADADVLVNARVVAATRDVTAFLLAQGYELTDISFTDVAHRFSREGVEIDVLAPDGLGERADISTVPPTRTIHVPGGWQALRRSERVEIQWRSVVGEVPRPDLLGAILIKVRAIAVDDAPAAQQADLALLLSLVLDPDPLADEGARAERRWLQRHRYFADPNDPVCAFNRSAAERGATVFRRLANI